MTGLQSCAYVTVDDLARTRRNCLVAGAAMAYSNQLNLHEAFSIGSAARGSAIFTMGRILRALKKHRLAFVAAAAALMLASGAIAQDSAQPASDSSSMPPEIRAMLPSGVTPQQAIEALKAAGVNPDEIDGSKPAELKQQTLSPGAAPKSAAPTHSSLEMLYSARAGGPIGQFGYDLIANGGSIATTLNGAIQDDYVLGTGDEIVITLQGQQNANYSTRVDRDGRVLFPNLPPIAAAGRSFGEFRRDLEAAARRAYIQTQVYVSVGEIRQISVRVVGEVDNPGVYSLTGLSTVLDALNLAGGVKKTGSLRAITLVRNGVPHTIDLYTLLLTHGETPDMTVAEGDRIVVPPIGSTVAVTGDVRRPAIYELPPGEDAITERDAMRLASGPEIRGAYREMIQRIEADGKERLSDATGRPGAALRDGEILFVYKSVSASLGTVQLEGSVRLPGLYALDHAQTLHDLIPSADVLAPTPYMLLGVIERIDPKTLQRSLVPFSLIHVLEGKENLPLLSGDIVHVLTVAQMRAFAAAQTQADQNAPWAQSGHDFIAMPEPASAPEATPATPVNENAQTDANITGAAPGPISDAQGDLGDLSAEDAAFFGHVLGDYRVTLHGAVRNTGIYLVSPGTTLDEAVQAAGGLDTDADVSSFGITSTDIDNTTGHAATERKQLTVPPAQYASVVLHPRDVIEFHHVFTDMAKGTVRIAGEVRYGGTYSFLRGEHLSQLLVRAGGLTDVAYPYGTVFLRRSVAAIEKAGYERVADEVQRQMLAATARAAGREQSSAPSSEALAASTAFVSQLRDQKALGRISIIADPSVLAAHPGRDPILEPGDSIYIPQRPSTVTVLGDVMQPGSYSFDSGSNAGDYIDQAGGYGDNAEKDLTYVVYPDGTAHRLESSWLQFGGEGIPPGSVIYVPRQLFPTDWLALTTSIADVVKDFAISIASVAVLSKN
jgi:polysaccharide export outer membrane protein